MSAGAGTASSPHSTPQDWKRGDEAVPAPIGPIERATCRHAFEEDRARETEWNRRC